MPGTLSSSWHLGFQKPWGPLAEGTVAVPTPLPGCPGEGSAPSSPRLGQVTCDKWCSSDPAVQNSPEWREFGGFSFHSFKMFADSQEAEIVCGVSRASTRLPQPWHLMAAVKLQDQEIDSGTARQQAWLGFHSFKRVSVCTHVFSETLEQALPAVRRCRLQRGVPWCSPTCQGVPYILPHM